MAWSRSDLWIRIVLGMVLLVRVEVVAQDRTFAPEPDVLLGLNTDRSASLTFADLDGDGDLDVIVANGRHWTQPNEIFINNGEGRFTLGYTLGEELTTSYAVPAGDLDGDGDLDIVVGNDRAPNLIYLNDGSGRFEFAGNLDDVTDLTRGVYLSDLDGDDDLDVLVTNRRAANTIYLNDGVGGFDRKNRFGTSEDSTIKMALGDLDGDEGNGSRPGEPRRPGQRRLPQRRQRRVLRFPPVRDRQ